jgi:uncharacterized protein (DUF2252 family)
MTTMNERTVGLPDRREANARGKELRKQTARGSHSGWSAPKGRDPIAILEEQNADRVPELVPVRMGRMAESPFAFYRGAAAVMASDLASTPVTGIEVQACGDAHLVNFGLFASPERTLLFDVNDFDETLQAPWEWDVKRLAASAVVAARQNGLDEATATRIARAGVRSYRERMAVFAEMSPLDIYYTQVDAESALALSKTALPRAKKVLAKIEKNTSARALSKLTVTTTDGASRIVDEPPILLHPKELESGDLVRHFMENYRATLRRDVEVLFEHFHLVDVALKVVGVGSVGTRCFIALFVDRDGAPLFLQIKEAERSVLEPHWKPASDAQQGQRVVDGQLIMQAASDVFLGWATGDGGRHFYVRQFKDMKGSVDVPTLTLGQLVEYLELCGWTLARAHAQSGNAQEIAGYLGGGEQFDEAVTDFSLAYADQSERDHNALVEAIESGRLLAERGV